MTNKRPRGDTMEWTTIHHQHQTIKKMLKVLKEELVSLSRDEGVDDMMMGIIEDFFSHQVHGYHFKEEGKYIETIRSETTIELINSMNRMKRLSLDYFGYFTHYWRCFQEGNTLAKYDVIAYGESYLIAMNRIIHEEEKLFNLTRNHCIVK